MFVFSLENSMNESGKTTVWTHGHIDLHRERGSAELLFGERQDSPVPFEELYLTIFDVEDPPRSPLRCPTVRVYAAFSCSESGCHFMVRCGLVWSLVRFYSIFRDRRRRRAQKIGTMSPPKKGRGNFRTSA